jgi:hypothetical protein
MATSTKTSHRYPYPVTTVAAVMVASEYLRARLAEVGGEHSELVSCEQDPSGTTTIVQRHGIPSTKIPSFVRALVPGRIAIERTETWRRHGEDAAATVRATVSGTPGVIEGSLDLAPSGTTNCVLTVTMRVTVPLPIVGRRVETFVVEQLVGLLDKEHEFTVEWLATHQ